MAQVMLEHDPNYAGTHLALALVADHDGNKDTARREAGLALKAWTKADQDLPELKSLSSLAK
jgi:Tfp pilus assembly protein PilF